MKVCLALLMCLVTALSQGCARHAPERTAALFAMDTYLSVRFYSEREDLKEKMAELVQDIEAQLSVTRESSDIAVLNRQGSLSALREHTQTLLPRALRLCEETGGALDISVYPIVRAWGFTTGAYRRPAQEDLQALLPLVDHRRIHMDESGVSLKDGMMIDVGSLGKGYTTDQMAKLLRQNGVQSALIDFGGNIHSIGSKPDGSAWRIAVRMPEGEGSLGVIESRDEAIITSGGYERYFTDGDGQLWWHIMDPATGYPARNGLISVTVAGPEGVHCDGLSTALFVMGPEKAVRFWQAERDFDMLLVTETGEILITPALEKRFTRDAACPYTVRVIGDD